METNTTETLTRLRDMAAGIKHRPLLYGLVMADVYRWNEMSEADQAKALKRTIRRVSLVEPQLQLAV